MWLTWKNSFFRGTHSWTRRLSLALLAGLFWIGTYLVVRRVLRYFETVYELGPALAYQLLLIILLTFLSMLLFSNLVAALSTFFLARDLDLIHATPVAPNSFFFARLIATTINSSWMVLFFSLPIFAAYGSVFGGGIELYFWIAVILPLFLLIPAAIGALVTHLLVYAMPAKRIRDLLFFIGLFAFLIMYFLFRFSQPERLVQPESFGNFMQFLSAMETPSSPYLPSSWLAEILAGTIVQARHRPGFLLRPVGELRDVFTGGGQLVFQRGLSRRLVESPGIAPGPAQTRLARPPARSDNPAVPGDHPRVNAQGHQDVPARHHPVVAAVSARRLDRRLSLQLQSSAPRPLADAGGDYPNDCFLRQLGLSRIRLERHRHPLRLSGGEFGRQSLLAASDRADFAASIVVEQVLDELHTAPIPRRSANISPAISCSKCRAG